MRKSLSVLLLAVASTSAGAQIVRPRFQLKEPSAWASLGIGYSQGWSVADGTTSSDWRFGSATQFIASLEKSVSNGVSVGVRATTARVPLRYSGYMSTTGSVNTDADANVSQGFLTLRAAGGGAFHTAFELSAGGTVYSNFQSRATGARLGSGGADTDFSFAFGYGFGYNFNPRFAVDVVQDMTTAVHQKDGLAASDDSSVRISGTRIVARFGMGGR